MQQCPPTQAISGHKDGLAQLTSPQPCAGFWRHVGDSVGWTEQQAGTQLSAGSCSAPHTLLTAHSKRCKLRPHHLAIHVHEPCSDGLPAFLQQHCVALGGVDQLLSGPGTCARTVEKRLKCAAVTGINTITSCP
jgi:hypothetical protein